MTVRYSIGHRYMENPRVHSADCVLLACSDLLSPLMARSGAQVAPVPIAPPDGTILSIWDVGVALLLWIDKHRKLSRGRLCAIYVAA